MNDDNTMNKPSKSVEALATKGRDEKLEVWTLTLDRFVSKNQPEICWILFHPMFQDNSDHLANLLSDVCCALFPHLRLVVGQYQVDKIRPSLNLMFHCLVVRDKKPCSCWNICIVLFTSCCAPQFYPWYSSSSTFDA